MNTIDLQWFWKNFDQLTKNELYELLQFRQEIFVVEQKSWYLDADSLDQFSHHLLVKSNDKLIGYLRLTPPGKKYEVASIGRIAIHHDMRRDKIGSKIVKEGLKKSSLIYTSNALRISAQEYLIGFYEEHGFKIEGEVYDEDGIPHIQMLIDG